MGDSIHDISYLSMKSLGEYNNKHKAFMSMNVL